MAHAIHTGAMRLLGRGAGIFGPENLTCSPAPCVTPNVQASEGGSPVNEDPIAANPRNPMQLLTGGNDYNCASFQGFFASGDGGSTWNHTCMNTLAGKFGFGDPGVGYDLHGTAYITGIDANSDLTDGSIVFERSTDNGMTWTAPKIAVHPTFAHGLSDKDWLQIDTNRTSPHANTLYISTTQFDLVSTGDIEVAVSHSSNGGTTWTTTVVDTPQVSPNIEEFTDLAIGKDGTVYLTWMRCLATGPKGDCGGTTAMIMFSKSTDGGNTWSAPAEIGTTNLVPDNCACAFYGNLPNTHERVSNIPAIDIDNSTGPHAGTLYVVIYNWTGHQMQVFVSSSTNGGASWNVPVRVAPTSGRGDQFFPWLTVNSSGAVGVTWLDRRNDPAHLSYQAFAAVSQNGGASFGVNFALTSALSNPINDGFGGFFMVDYTGNIWVGHTLYASWMDSSNGVDMQDQVGGLVQ